MTAVLAGIFLLTAAALPRFGDPEAPTMNEVARRYLEDGVEETGAVNAVAGMILEYRAFDTFGESAVLFAAGGGAPCCCSTVPGCGCGPSGGRIR